MAKKMKMKSAEKKSKKEEKVTLTKKRRCLSKENKQQSKFSKNVFGENNQSIIEKLINSLNDPFKKSEIYKDADFKIEFGSQIEDANFEELFKKGINDFKKFYTLYKIKLSYIENFAFFSN
jgi:hypothetical protein